MLGRDEGEGGILGHANELKDRLHFAQLYFAFKYLKPGGMVLMRHHMSVRLVDYHFLALMISLFNPDDLALTNVFKRQQASEEISATSSTLTSPTTSTAPTAKMPTPTISRKASWADVEDDEEEEEEAEEEQMEKTTISSGGSKSINTSQDARALMKAAPVMNLKPTIMATKPMAEFAIRKTYWVMYQGFDKKAMEDRDVLNILLEMLRLEPNCNAYSLNENTEGEEKPYFMPHLCGRGVSLSETLQTYGEQCKEVLETVWKMQVVALQGFMDGKKDRMCKFGPRRCRQFQRGRCGMAHYPEEMVEECWLALNAIPKDSPYLQGSY